MAKRKIEFVADFETTSVRKYKMVACSKIKNGKKIKFTRQKLDRENSEAWVSAWGLASIDKCNTSSDVITGRTIQEFFKTIYDIEKKYPKNEICIFFYNASFDSDFIAYHALSNHLAVIYDEVRDTKLYSFKLGWTDERFEEHHVKIIDLAKIFPGSVDKLGTLYGIPKLKGDWDYNKYRDENTPISDEEWEYVKHDVLIIGTALKDYRDRGYTQNTLAAIAYNDRLKKTYPQFDKNKASYLKEKNYERFRKAFPMEIQPLPEFIHKVIHKAYYGGMTYLNPYFCCKLLKELVYSYDENSMYPDKMKNAVLPIGQPRVYDAHKKEVREYLETLYPCIVYHINSITMKLKSSHHIPMAMFPTQENMAQRSQGKIVACFRQECYLTNIDLQMIYNEYDIIDIDIGTAYCFKGKKGKYQQFVDYWMDRKEEATIKMEKAQKAGDIVAFLKWSQIRQISKLMLNSSYGKDGTKLVRERKETVMENGLLENESTIEEAIIEYYIPDAVFITAYARKDWYEMAKSMGDEFIYGDTDSGKTTERGKALFEASGKPIHDTKLGAWKMEYIYEESKFVRQKTYATKKKGKEWEYTVCGATEDVKALMDIEDFQPGMEITLDMLHHIGKYAFKNRQPKIRKICHNKYRVKNHRKMQGKLIPVRVKGGVILEETGFNINDIENWDEECRSNIPIKEFIDYTDNRAGDWLKQMEVQYGKI